MDTPLAFPRGSLIGMSVYDLDGGPNNEYVEKIIAKDYAYYLSPLQPAYEAGLGTALEIDKEAGVFASKEAGDSTNNPSDPLALTDEQARRAVPRPAS